MNNRKPHYTPETNEAIFQQLRYEVFALVARLQRKRKKSIFLKVVLFPAAYLLTYLTAIFYGNHLVVFYCCYFLLGLQLVFIFLNTIHDAVHGTIFRSRKLNRWYAYFFDLMGANSYIWILRHTRFHHNYPNVQGWDTDIEQSNLFRIFPTGPYLKFHRFQHIYLPLLYPFYLPNWLLVRDFRDYFHKNRLVNKLITIPAQEYVKLFLFKSLFLFYIIVLPVLLLNIGWIEVLAGFFLLLFTASLTALVVLLSPHATVEAEFPLPDPHNCLPHSWMMHMLKTTNDVSNDNWFTRFFMGCFNYHVAHHLFPNINHVYYPEITQMVRKYAGMYQWPYKQYSLFRSLKNHYLLLKQNRKPEHIFEETM